MVDEPKDFRFLPHLIGSGADIIWDDDGSPANSKLACVYTPALENRFKKISVDELSVNPVDQGFEIPDDSWDYWTMDTDEPQGNINSSHEFTSNSGSEPTNGTDPNGLKYCEYDGLIQYSSLYPNQPTLPESGVDYTFMGWVYLFDAQPAGTTWYITDFNPGFRMKMEQSPKKLFFSFCHANPPGWFSTSNFNLDGWNHFCISYDWTRGQMVFWLNGEQVYSLPTSDWNDGGGNNPLRLGCISWGGNRTKCRFAELIYFEEAIDPAEIYYDYNRRNSTWNKSYFPGIAPDVDDWGALAFINSDTEEVSPSLYIQYPDLD